MSRRSEDRRPVGSDAPRADRRSLRLIHGTIAYAAMLVGLPVALVGATAMAGELIDNLWIRSALAALMLVVIPMLLADRLLPKDPSKRKPGLVRDVFAGTWAATAIAALALTGPLTAGPLQREASELARAGWARAAYLAQWMAGPPTSETEAADPDASALAAVNPPEPELTATQAGEAAALPEPEPTTLAATEASDTGAAKPDTEAPGPEPAATEERDYSPAELFSVHAASVVSIKVGHHGFSSGGTGFIIDDQGTIATNHHVIDDASEVVIKTLDGVELERVELLASDPAVDLALLRVDPAKLGDATRPVTLGDSETVEVGEPVSVIGNPLGLEHTLTNGIVSARRVYEGKRYIQMSAPISPGNSGGPVFDHHARVIAVSVATMFGGQNLNLAVPVSQLEAMIADDYPNRRSFGASSW